MSINESTFYSIADSGATGNSLPLCERMAANHAGASAMGTAIDLNAYTRYYEFRMYDQGPFRSRPGDTASLVAS